MKQFPLIGLAAAAIVFLLDQATKFIVTDVLGLDVLAGRAIELLPVFRIRFVANEGVSLGLLTAGSDGARWALVALTSAIAAGVLVWMFRERNRQDQFALGLVLGGALGNIIDRARLGYVVDFADLHIGEWSPFLVFNLADAAITIGVLVLLVRAILVRDRPAAKVSVENGNA
ncbi:MULTISPECIES: signal peptidase II [unclassified Sphingomonas]|uniref:signal peptidase II n=1 Tax=unclassified Sphingomonas TaxID=196159 RepID=UPI000BD6560B|nr:MAG: signal peptidase II [Sphingomonas sp. 12-62-6]OYX38501.1 MAG: signal peptidase II [Sphingomonas sp. 32-62-10]